MNKAKDVLGLLTIGISIGVVLTLFMILVVRMQPKEISLGGVSWEIPTTYTERLSNPIPPNSELAQLTTPPTPSPTPKLSNDLWQFYVNDVKSTLPNAEITADTLKEIARKIPSNVSFFAEAEVGLIPYQHTWKILDREGPTFLNAPEGGYAYIAWGYGTITTDYFSVSFPAVEDHAHLILAIGNPNDGTHKDLNTQLRLTDYHAGFAGTNFAAPVKEQTFPNRKVVNKAWFAQQLWWASRHRSITVTILDVSNGNYFIYDVNPSSFVWMEK